MPRSRSVDSEPGKPRPRNTRSDAGRKKLSLRDWRGIHFVAEQTFVTVEQIGQWLAPEYEPAVDLPSLEPSQHGGNRHLAWPRDRKRRLHATMQLVRRWERDHGLVDVWQPLSEWASWVRATPLALRQLGLDWQAIPFPLERARLEPGCHVERITHTRLFLARGALQTPAHRWISERQIWAEMGEPHAGDKRPHRPDGYLVLLEDGAFDLTRHGQTVVTTPMKAGQRVAIEVERSRKNDSRLEAILPDLLRQYDFAWYFCMTSKVYQAVVEARRDALHTDEERARIRILSLDES